MFEIVPHFANDENKKSVSKDYFEKTICVIDISMLGSAINYGGLKIESMCENRMKDHTLS